MNEKSDFISGWDAREATVNTIVFRWNLVLNADFNDVQGWFEKLRDYFKAASGIIRHFEQQDVFGNMKKELCDIDQLIYSKTDEKNNTFTRSELNKRKLMAHDKMHDFEMEITYLLTRHKILLPLHQRSDPKKAIMG